MDRMEFLSQLHANFAAPSDAVTDLVERTTGQVVLNVARLLHGDENEVYRVHLDDGNTVFVRIGRPDSPDLSLYREARVMEYARRSGIPVPVVLAVKPIVDAGGQRHAMLVTAANGRPLSDLMPSMSSGRRVAALRELGRILAKLHTVPMPGPDMPSGAGGSPDHTVERRRYIQTVIADCNRLHEAGLRESEIDDVRHLLRQELDAPPPRQALVLCHGDLSTEHVFIDQHFQISGIIDWGMWSAAAAEDDLADVAMRISGADFEAVLEGHSGHQHHKPQLRRAIWMALMMRVIGHLRWLLDTGQTGQTRFDVESLRRALANLT